MFIVIEGIDGAGCETQAKNLQALLKRNNVATSFVKYPDYTRNIGPLIKDFMYKNENLDANAQFLIYSLQFFLDCDWIAKERQKKIVVADRYFTTTLCFQTLQGVPLTTALRFANDFAIEKPDLVFYLNVRPEIARIRKSGEAKVKNRHEKDFVLINKTYQQYAMLIKKQLWVKWIDIDGEREIDDVTKDIYNKILSTKS